MIYELAAELYPDYADPLPAFSYLGGNQGKGQLESALSTPRQTWEGRYLARTVFDKAAVQFRSIVKNHPLVDGNKRLGLTCTMVFLNANGYLFWRPRAEAVDFAVRVAEDNPGVKEIASWLRRGSISYKRLRGMSQSERRRFHTTILEGTAFRLRELRLQVGKLERDIERLLASV